jgi:hypothetical protein
VLKNLGKEYRIGAQVDNYPTLRDSLVDAVKRALVRMLKHGYAFIDRNDLGF